MHIELLSFLHKSVQIHFSLICFYFGMDIYTRTYT